MQSLIHISSRKGIARTQTPTNKNYALELFTFETIVGVNLSVVQWTGLTLGEIRDSNPAQYERNRRFGHLVHVLGRSAGGAKLPSARMTRKVVKRSTFFAPDEL